MAKKTTEKQLIAQVIGERTLRDAAAWLNEELPTHFQRSHMAVKYWLDEIYNPDDVFVQALIAYYVNDDPRHQLAVNILALRGEREVIKLEEDDARKLLKAVKP